MGDNPVKDVLNVHKKAIEVVTGAELIGQGKKVKERTEEAAAAAEEATKLQRKELSNLKAERAEDKARLGETRKRDARRKLQQSKLGEGTGRSSTILTTGNEPAGPSARKTLLGQ